MTDLRTGPLDFGQLDAEVVAIVDDLRAFGIASAFVTFGFGCERNTTQWQDVPVPVAELVRFVADSEADGRFDFGESDLLIRGGGVEFKLSHECDVHCSGEEGPLLTAVRERWRRQYRGSGALLIAL